MRTFLRNSFVRLLAASGAVLSGAALAAGAPPGPGTGYAVVSLIGDKLSVVTHEASTGTMIERNKTQTLPVNGTVFDAEVMAQAEAALKRADAQARVSLYDLSSPAMFEQQERFLEGGKLHFSPAVVATMRKEGATHLVLVTKQLATAQLRAGDHDGLGSGYLQGMGFYIDRAVHMIENKSGETGRGYFAPFVFAKVTLVDLDTLDVVNEASVKVNISAASVGVAASPDAWDALTPQGKISALRSLIDDHLPQAVASVVAGGR